MDGRECPGIHFTRYYTYLGQCISLSGSCLHTLEKLRAALAGCLAAVRGRRADRRTQVSQANSYVLGHCLQRGSPLDHLRDGREGGGPGSGSAGAQGSSTGGQGGLLALRGVQARAAGGLQHTWRTPRIWAGRSTCTAHGAYAGGSRGASRPATGPGPAGQGTHSHMYSPTHRSQRHKGADPWIWSWIQPINRTNHLPTNSCSAHGIASG